MKKQIELKNHGPVPLKKFYNKLFVSNVIWSIGLLMLIVCFLCANQFVGQSFTIEGSTEPFNGTDLWIGNIVMSSLILVIGYGMSLFFTIRMNLKGEKAIAKNWQLATSICVNTCPLIGAIIAYTFKVINKKALYKKNKRLSKEKSFIPSSITIIFMILIFAVVAIWFVYMISGGLKNEDGALKPVPGVLNIFAAPVQGFINAADLIIFLIAIGGFLSVVAETKALDAGIGTLVKKMNGKEIWLIPILMTLFAIGGATFGMCEETLPFYLIIIPIMIAGGFDVITAFLLILIGAGVGVASSIINPFVVTLSVDAINKNLLEGQAISMSDGIVFRVIAFVIFVSIAITFVMLYAKKVKKNPQKSIVYDERAKFNKSFSFDKSSIPPLTRKRKAILWIFGLSFLIMIFMVINWQGLTDWNGFNDFNAWLTTVFPFILTPNNDISGAIGTWYLVEMAMLFFFASLIVAMIDWKGEQNYLNAFYNGAKDFITVGLIIAAARGISIILSSSGVDSLIVDGLGAALGAMGSATLAILLIFVVFIGLSILIPSTSGFASAVMPMVGPALVNAGIPASAGILTFAFTSGLINMTSPTSGPFVAALSLSKMELTDYYKGAWKLILTLLVVMLAILLIGATLVQFGILSNQGSVIF